MYGPSLPAASSFVGASMPDCLLGLKDLIGNIPFLPIIEVPHECRGLVVESFLACPGTEVIDLTAILAGQSNLHRIQVINITATYRILGHTNLPSQTSRPSYRSRPGERPFARTPRNRLRALVSKATDSCLHHRHIASDRLDSRSAGTATVWTIWPFFHDRSGRMAEAACYPYAKLCRSMLL